MCVTELSLLAELEQASDAVGVVLEMLTDPAVLRHGRRESRQGIGNHPKRKGGVVSPGGDHWLH